MEIKIPDLPMFYYIKKETIEGKPKQIKMAILWRRRRGKRVRMKTEWLYFDSFTFRNI